MCIRRLLPAQSLVRGLVLLVVFCASPVGAADIFWEGGVSPSSMFGNANNWNPNQIPGSRDRTIWDLDETCVVGMSIPATNAEAPLSIVPIGVESDRHLSENLFDATM